MIGRHGMIARVPRARPALFSWRSCDAFRMLDSPNVLVGTALSVAYSADGRAEARLASAGPLLQDCSDAGDEPGRFNRLGEVILIARAQRRVACIRLRECGQRY